MDLQELVSTLTSDQKRTLLSILTQENFLDKSNIEELRFTNGFHCPKCGCTENIIKKGKYKNKQRYLCKSCGHIFTYTTQTFLNSTKKDISVWKKYIECMLNHFSLRKTCKECGISLRTSFMWRHKILDSLRNSNETTVKGIVESDETFFHVSYKGQKGKNQKNNIKKRGLSRDQVCVPCVIERENKITFSKIGGLGKTSHKSLEVLDKVIQDNSVLCTDKEKSYIKFSLEHNLEHIRLEKCNSKKGIYHIQNINGYHSRLKRFMKPFNGVSTKHLNNYLTWNNLIQENVSKTSSNLLQESVLVKCFKNHGYTLYTDISSRPSIPMN